MVGGNRMVVVGASFAITGSGGIATACVGFARCC
jgi:hypothetical protein